MGRGRWTTHAYGVVVDESLPRGYHSFSGNLHLHAIPIPFSYVDMLHSRYVQHLYPDADCPSREVPYVPSSTLVPYLILRMYLGTTRSGSPLQRCICNASREKGWSMSNAKQFEPCQCVLLASGLPCKLCSSIQHDIKGPRSSGGARWNHVMLDIVVVCRFEPPSPL